MKRRSPDSDPLAHLGSGDVWGRPYTITGGRTHPSTPLDLMTMIKATGRGSVRLDQLGHEHAIVLRLCREAIVVAEVAARLRQPTSIAKVLVSDLIAIDAVVTKSPSAYSTDSETLEALLVGLRNL